jgi:hypothetical protein
VVKNGNSETLLLGIGSQKRFENEPTIFVRFADQKEYTHIIP